MRRTALRKKTAALRRNIYINLRSAAGFLQITSTPRCAAVFLLSTILRMTAQVSLFTRESVAQHCAAQENRGAAAQFAQHQSSIIFNILFGRILFAQNCAAQENCGAAAQFAQLQSSIIFNILFRRILFAQNCAAQENCGATYTLTCAAPQDIYKSPPLATAPQFSCSVQCCA